MALLYYFTAAYHLVIMVENRKLPWRNCQLGFMKTNGVTSFLCRNHLGWCALMAVTDLGEKFTGQVRFFPGKPIYFANR